MVNKILMNFVFILMGILICFENILIMIVFFWCWCMILYIKILVINFFLMDFCIGFMFCLLDDIVNSCIYKKYLVGLFVVFLLIIIVIFIERFCVLIFVLRYYKIVIKRFFLFICICIWIFLFLFIYVMFYDICF